MSSFYLRATMSQGVLCGHISFIRCHLSCFCPIRYLMSARQNLATQNLGGCPGWGKTPEMKLLKCKALGVQQVLTTILKIPAINRMALYNELITRKTSSWPCRGFFLNKESSVVTAWAAGALFSAPQMHSQLNSQIPECKWVSESSKSH